MAKNLIDRETGIGLREYLTFTVLDGTEAGGVSMAGTALLDLVIDTTYEWLRGVSGEREAMDLLAVLAV